MKEPSTLGHRQLGWMLVCCYNTPTRRRTMSTFGEMLKVRRKELRLGLREFALRADMDPGNLSKIERGKLGAPQGEDVLNRICLALEFELGSEEAQALRDKALVEAGRIPAEVMEDEEVLKRLPVLLRTVKNKKLDSEQLDRLIEMIKEA
jgi:transcriptional regulator with XRE-family HTH domain